MVDLELWHRCTTATKDAQAAATLYAAVSLNNTLTSKLFWDNFGHELTLALRVVAEAIPQGEGL